MKKKISKQISDKKGKHKSGKPRKYVSLLKEQGYTLSEINTCIQAMMAMDVNELAVVEQDISATVLEKTVARAMIKSMESGSLQSVKALLDQAYSSQGESNDGNSGMLKINVRFNDDTDASQQP